MCVLPRSLLVSAWALCRRRCSAGTVPHYMANLAIMLAWPWSVTPLHAHTWCRGRKFEPHCCGRSISRVHSIRIEKCINTQYENTLRYVFTHFSNTNAIGEKVKACVLKLHALSNKKKTTTTMGPLSKWTVQIGLGHVHSRVEMLYNHMFVLSACNIMNYDLLQRARVYIC